MKSPLQQRTDWLVPKVSLFGYFTVLCKVLYPESPPPPYTCTHPCPSPHLSLYAHTLHPLPLPPHTQTYEDLDEILARFVQPMASFAKDLITHKCYKPADGGNVDQLKKLLVEEKSKNPKHIPYLFSASKQYPGKFCLSYQPGSKHRIEYLTPTPHGFRYRSRIHSSVDRLLKWFKGHCQEPIMAPPTAVWPLTSPPLPMVFHVIL